jgi:inhibitor of KinA
MNHEIPEFRAMGDRSLIVYFGEGIDRAVNDRVRRLFLYHDDHPMKGVIEAVPGYNSLLYLFDPFQTTSGVLQEAILDMAKTIDNDPIPDPEIVEIPVVYGGEYGPDLEWVAQYHSVETEEIIRLHTQHIYHVYMIGFTPGFPYMGELPAALMTPRKETPRTAVPRGSVGLAQEQTGIYPSKSPGGWQVIGRTPLKLFDSGKKPPALLQMGDQVRFVSVTGEAMEQ